MEDAVLMAAAPDLLEALKAALARLVALEDCGADTIESAATVQVRAAIEKATKANVH